MTERKRFVLETHGGLFTHAKLCRRHGVGRKTGYKFLWRYEAEGPDGLPGRIRTDDGTPSASMALGRLAPAERSS